MNCDRGNVRFHFDFKNKRDVTRMRCTRKSLNCTAHAGDDQNNGGHVESNPANRPLSRRLDRCDRVIHNESGDPNGGNMCSLSGATCTSRVRHNADYVAYANIRFDL